MPLVSAKEALRLKLTSLPRPALDKICRSKQVYASGWKEDIVKKLVNLNLTSTEVDTFIKQGYAKRIRDRQAFISTEELKYELGKVTEFSWGVVQGALDNKIQNEYVRRYARFDELVTAVGQKLHSDLTSYVICSWYNHWSTVLTEEYISQHPRVVPVLARIKGIDIFFDDQPFDLKITYLPANYDFDEAKSNPKDLAVWLYENQGAQRFGADNRLFVVLYDLSSPGNSWMLKRDFDLIENRITQFFNHEKVDTSDEVIFSFQNRTYTTISKLLFIFK